MTIDIGREYSLPVLLEVGNIQESVTVTAGVDVLNATTGELSNTVSNRQIIELPLNGRNPLNLIALQPGVSSNGAQNTSINGLRTSFTNITRDGLNVQDGFIRSNATDFSPNRPSVDNTGEFTITTSNSGADQNGGAQVRQVTGTTFREVLEDVRFEAARQLLESTELPLDDIADALGYAGASAFTRAFRRRAGTPPGQWRRSGA